MLRNCGNALLISILTLSLVAPARAESLDTAGKQIYAGIAAVGVAVTIGVVLLVRHEKQKTRTLTGCVTATARVLSLTDDTDKQVYALGGTPAGLKPGERLTLDGKRHGKRFDARSVIKDLGVCQP